MTFFCNFGTGGKYIILMRFWDLTLTSRIQKDQIDQIDQIERWQDPCSLNLIYLKQVSGVTLYVNKLCQQKASERVTIKYMQTRGVYCSRELGGLDHLTQSQFALYRKFWRTDIPLVVVILIQCVFLSIKKNLILINIPWKKSQDKVY